jgi:hypothetical protein
MRWTTLRAYSYLCVGTDPTNKERSEKMFYGDYSYELAKERMDDAIKAHERDTLVKQVRAARKSRHTSPAGWATAVVTTLFR